MFQTILTYTWASSKSIICGEGDISFFSFFKKVLGIKKDGFPFKYLDLPPTSKVLKFTHFNSLFDKLSSYLSDQKNKFCFGGQFLLLRSSIKNILILRFKSMVIPKGIVQQQTSLPTSFFFQVREIMKLHLISQEKTTLPHCK